MDIATSREASVFTKSFIDLLQRYNEHSESFLRVQREDYGQVRVSLAVDIVTKRVFKEILSPVSFNPIGFLGLISWVRRDTPAHLVLWRLFLRILASPCGGVCDITGEEEVLHSIYRVVPKQVQESVVEALQANILPCQVVQELKKIPDISVYAQFCAIESSRCIFFYEGQQIDRVEGKIVDWLLPFLNQTKKESHIPPDALLSWIAETHENTGYLLRALALGMSREVSSPVCSLIEAVIPTSAVPEWTHNLNYEIHLGERPVVIQHGTSQTHVLEGDVVISWQLTIKFDSRLCPRVVQCSLKQILGVPQEVSTDFASHFCGKWHRSVLGNIKALFHRPDPKSFMVTMIAQARLFDGRSPEFNPHQEEDLHRSVLGSVSPNFIALLQLFSVPQEIQDKAFVPNVFEEYLRGKDVPPSLVGVLIAVSSLPFREVATFIERSFPSTSAHWTHKGSRIEIAIDRLHGGVIVHSAVSTLTENSTDLGSVSWSLKIQLSPCGHPEDISLNVNETGSIALPHEGPVYVFAPPPHPLKRDAVDPSFVESRCSIPTPKDGVVVNGSLLTLRQGEEALNTILAKLFGEEDFFRAPISEILSRKHPLENVLRALIVGFSESPILSSIGFLGRVRPLREGETWEHRDVFYEITTDDEKKTLTLHRRIESGSFYRYKDLFQQEQVRLMAYALWEIVQDFDMYGDSQGVRVCFSKAEGFDSCDIAGVMGSWRSPLGIAVKQVFRARPPIEEILMDLARMQQPCAEEGCGRFVFKQSQPQPALVRIEDVPKRGAIEISRIRVFDRGVQILDHFGKSGLELLLERQDFPKEIRESLKNPHEFNRIVQDMYARCSAWDTFLQNLHVPAHFACTEDNIPIFFAALREAIEKVVSLEEDAQKLGLGDLSSPGLCLKVWREQDRNQKILDFLTVLGIVGGWKISHCIQNLFETENWGDSLGGVTWRHTLTHVDVNLLDGGSFECTQLVRSARIDGALKEIAVILPSIKMRFGRGNHLEMITTSVNEIYLSMPPNGVVEKILSSLSFTFDCQRSQEIVSPVVSVDLDQEKRLKAGVYRSVRIAGDINAYVMNRESASFLRNVSAAFLELNQISPVINEISVSIASKYLVVQGAPLLESSILTTHNTVQASLYLAEKGRARVCYTIISTLYPNNFEEQMSHFSKAEQVQWRIEVLLDALGKPYAISVLDFEKKFISDSLASWCETTLRKTYGLVDPIKWLYAVSL
jgi:hypothetical protein